MFIIWSCRPWHWTVGSLKDGFMSSLQFLGTKACSEVTDAPFHTQSLVIFFCISHPYWKGWCVNVGVWSRCWHAVCLSHGALADQNPRIWNLKLLTLSSHYKELYRTEENWSYFYAMTAETNCPHLNVSTRPCNNNAVWLNTACLKLIILFTETQNSPLHPSRTRYSSSGLIPLNYSRCSTKVLLCRPVWNRVHDHTLLIGTCFSAGAAFTGLAATISS